jgi:2-amino-4-hydroxy-6-hydroxymethyldihydropteridine diphosphokinase
MPSNVISCYLGLGANLDEPLAKLKLAAQSIGAMRECSQLRCSSIYRSAPQETTRAQPDYFNAVVSFATTRNATSVWHELHAIEHTLGRTRAHERNSARTIDIDLLLYGDQVLSDPAHIVPHPRMTQRAFVLLPLVELAPNIAIPGHGLARDLLDAVKHQRIEKLSAREGFSLCN